MSEWWRDLSKVQIGLFGGVVGFAFGLFSGPVLRLILTVLVLVIFGLVGRSIESQFEARLGFTGIVAVILVVANLGPIQDWMGQFLGDFFAGISHLVLTVLGIVLAIYIHRALQEEAEEEM